MSVSLLDLIFGAGDPTPAHYEGDYDLTTRGDGAMWRLRAYRELGEREALRKGCRSRQRPSWARKAARVVASILRRGDRAPAGPPERGGRGLPMIGPSERCSTCGLPPAFISPPEPVLDPAGMDPISALMLARAAAERDGEQELRDALHHLLVLNCAGAVADVLPFLAESSLKISRAPVAQKGEVN